MSKNSFELTMCIYDKIDGRTYTTSDYFNTLEECTEYAAEYELSHSECKIDFSIYRNGKLIYWS